MLFDDLWYGSFMADALYPDGKEAFLGGDIDVDTDTIKVALCSSSDYTYSASHTFLSSVTRYSGTTDQTLSTKTKTDGVFDSSDTLTFSAVAIDGSKDVDQVVIYQDTGVAGTSRLIAFYDSFTAVTPNGTDITFDANASGLFAL